MGQKKTHSPGAPDLDAIRAANPDADVRIEDGRIIVAAVANLAGHGVLGGQQSPMAQELEDAARAAVELALREGWSVMDTAAILAYKRWARAMVLQHYGQAVDVPARPTPREPREVR